MKRLTALFVLMLLLANVCSAQFVGSSLWTNLKDYTWATDASFTSLDDRLYLNPYESAADTTGKAAHYIIGAASRYSRVFTYPLQVSGYDTVTVQAYVSNCGLATADAYLASATQLAGYFNVNASLYPSGYIASSSIYGASTKIQYLGSFGGNLTTTSLATGDSLYHALSALWVPLYMEPIAGFNPVASSMVANVSITGASDVVPRHPYIQGGIYKANLGGGVSYVMLDFQGLTIPAEVVSATTELIIRVD